MTVDRRRVRIDARALVGALMRYVDGSVEHWTATLEGGSPDPLPAELEATFFASMLELAGRLIDERLEKVPGALGVVFDELIAEHPELDDLQT